jgi:Uma2 family endonuclease
MIEASFNVTSAMVLQAPAQRQQPSVTWTHLPDDFVLPNDPGENIQQPALAAALTDALSAGDRLQSQILIASNFGLVATVEQKTVVKAPDWFYVPQVLAISPETIRRSYTPSLEGDPVAVVIEFLSETDAGEYSIRPTYPYGKFYFFEQILKVPTYVIFDPLSLSLEVRCLQAGTYVLQAPNPEGRYWIPEIELFLGLWQGTRVGMTIHWLRWWDEAGQLLLWSSEQAEQERQRADQEHQRAETAIAALETERHQTAALAAKLKELGIDPAAL